MLLGPGLLLATGGTENTAGELSAEKPPIKKYGLYMML
jgi:hypothetical protein